LHLCPERNRFMSTIKVIGPGHVYMLPSLDGDVPQVLTFVKREGEKFPGNVGAHPGTTMQYVLRAVLDRITYLQGQIPCDENLMISNNLQNCLYLLEHRAARRHGCNPDSITQYQASYGQMCPTCGHVTCLCLPNPKPSPPVTSPTSS
jgi:hypothetical protein